MYSHRIGTCRVEHVASSYKLVGSRSVENGLRVNSCTHLEGNTSGEVSLDITRDNLRGGSLGGYHHVDANGTCQLCDTCNRQFYFLAGSHDQIAEFIDDYHDVRHIVVSVGKLQLVVDEFVVVFLDVAGSGHLQQVVSVVHQLAERVQRANHFRHIRDDGLFFSCVVGNLCHEVVHDGCIDGELHLLGVYQHELQLVGMLLI